MASVDLQDLSASLLERKAKAQELMVKQLTDGWGGLVGFRKLRVTDRIPLGSLVTKSLMQPGAKGTFNPKANAIKIQNRWGEVKPAKIDLLIDEKERLTLEATYFAEVEGTDGRNPDDFFMSDLLYEQAIEQAGVDTLQAVWRGEYDEDGDGAVDVVDGIVSLIDADIDSDERPEELVMVHSQSNFILDESNILSEIKALVKRFQLKLGAYALKPATLFMAPERLVEYQFALENYLKSANTLIYNSHKQVVLYFAPNIAIQPVDALVGTDFMMLEPNGNIVYLTDRREDKVSFEVDYDKRDRSVALMADWHFSPQYVRADIGVCNDLRVRPTDDDDDVTPPVTPPQGGGE